jgi:hypothetical protein
VLCRCFHAGEVMEDFSCRLAVAIAAWPPVQPSSGVICVRPRVWPAWLTDARCPGRIRPLVLDPRIGALGASPTSAVMILPG